MRQAQSEVIVRRNNRTHLIPRYRNQWTAGPRDRPLLSFWFGPTAGAIGVRELMAGMPETKPYSPKNM